MLSPETHTLVTLQVGVLLCYALTVAAALLFTGGERRERILVGASIPIAVFLICLLSLPAWLPTQEQENWLTGLILEGAAALISIPLARGRHLWIARELLNSLLSTLLAALVSQAVHTILKNPLTPPLDLHLVTPPLLLGFLLLYLKTRTKEIGYLHITEIPENYTNTEGNRGFRTRYRRPHHTPLNPEARGVIQTMHHRRRSYALTIKFERGAGKIFLLAEGGETEAEVLGASYRSHIPGLKTKSVSSLDIRVPYVAVAHLKKKARPLSGNPLDALLEHYAQNELYGLLMVYARPPSLLGEKLSRLLKKVKLNRSLRKPRSRRGYDERKEHGRAWETLEEGNVRLGVYAAVYAATDTEARRRAEIIAGVLAAGVEPPDVKVVSGRGAFRLLGKMLSLECGAPMDLLRGEASAFLQIPKRDIGTRIAKTAAFSQATPDPGDRGVPLGTLVRNGVELRRRVFLRFADLKSHLLIVGLTGTGKSNLIKHICIEAEREGVSFVVFDPVKREYRDLARLFRMNVFTVGDENTCPIRFNPLLFPRCVHAETHISNLVDIFRYAFVLWPPLPELLKMGLRQAYEEKGWNVTRNTPGETPDLRDLYKATDKLIDASQYEARVKADMRGALTTRLGSLTLGGTGQMFLCDENIPSVDDVLETPTVFELHQIGREDQPLVTALLLNHLYESMRCRGPSKSLRLLVFVDEAHRVVGQRTQDTGSEITSRGIILSSRIMGEMLSESRAYGMGLALSDQYPGRLMEDAIKNTKTKVIFHLPDEADRQLMGRSIGLDENQIRAMLGLHTGYAVYWVQGREPLHVKTVNVEKLVHSTPQMSDLELVDYMQPFYMHHPIPHNPLADLPPQTIYQPEKAEAAPEPHGDTLPSRSALLSQKVAEVALWLVREEKLAETYRMLQQLPDGNAEGFLREVAQDIAKYFPQPVEHVLHTLRTAIKETGR
ncbi:MAG: ATP-binding protein [Candidatus Freyarchaeota archaeon]